MTADASKATGRPWRIGALSEEIINARGIAAAARPDGGGVEAWEADAALIVERVNGWDALEAERDRLREALERIICRTDLYDAPGDDKAACLDRIYKIANEAIARAALGNGAGA